MSLTRHYGVEAGGAVCELCCLLRGSLCQLGPEGLRGALADLKCAYIINESDTLLFSIAEMLEFITNPA